MAEMMVGEMADLMAVWMVQMKVGKKDHKWVGRTAVWMAEKKVASMVA